MMLVDGLELGDPTDVALRDRRAISADGILFVVVDRHRRDARDAHAAEIVLRGVPLPAGEDELVEEHPRARSRPSLDRAVDEEIREVELIQQVLHDDLAKFVFKRLRRRPMILPVVIEV